MKVSHDQTVRRQIARFDRQEIKHTGDGFCVIFDAPTCAVRCAQAIVAAVPPLGLAARAGVHTGEFEPVGSDVAGVAVHIGARIAALAAADQVLLSSTVNVLATGSGIRFLDHGMHALKGIDHEWHLYATTAPDADPGADAN